jgi:hypothetical protein
MEVGVGWGDAEVPDQDGQSNSDGWALEKDKFLVVLPNTTEWTFTCGTEPTQTRQIKGQHRVRLGDKCGMSSMHFSLRQARQADGRKITIRKAVVNFTEWQAVRPEEEIFRAATSNDGYQTRAKEQLERGESGQNWPLIILATLLAELGAGIPGGRSGGIYVQAEDHGGTIRSNLGAKNNGRDCNSGADNHGGARGQEGEGNWDEAKSAEIADEVAWTEGGQRAEVTGEAAWNETGRGIPMGLVNKREKRTFEGLENLTKFMVSLQHSMGDGYARRPCDNCWDGKSTRDVDKGVLSTYCTGCATLNEPFASEEKKMEVWDRAKEMAILLPQ